jgi:ABC-2 type transport system ATP-binding protein
MPDLLCYDRLTKHYGRAAALTDMTLGVAPGEVVGLLGPNGSGKTTALRSVLGFLQPTRGQVTLGGFNCWSQATQARKLVTYLPGELRLYDTMTGRQIVSYLGKLRGEATLNQQINDLAARLDIDPDTPLTRMSSGMKRKMALLAALVPSAPLMILDEPTNTLDPNMRGEFLEQIRQAKRAGKAILFSSHVLAEVEAVCDRVAILKKGQLVHLQHLTELQDNRRVRGTLQHAMELQPPPGGEVTVNGLSFDMRHTGPLAELMPWLSGLPLADVQIQPQGLGPLYRQYHPGAEE